MAVAADAVGNGGADPGATRTSQAYHDLRALILSGHYAPDSRLTESELTTRLQVSRGTVRSVLARLAQEGYVSTEANRSARTRSFTEEEALEILETREVLESALAAKAAESATEEDIAAMTETCDRIGQHPESASPEEFSKLNRRFHEQVRAAARQATLTRFVDSLLYPLVLRQYRNMQRTRPRQIVVQEHKAILAAIATRNPEAAASTMRHHLSSVRHALRLENAPAD